MRAVDNLVDRWHGKFNAPPQIALQKIYNDVREQAVHDLAEAVKTGDVMRVHGVTILKSP